MLPVMDTELEGQFGLRLLILALYFLITLVVNLVLVLLEGEINSAHVL